MRRCCRPQQTPARAKSTRMCTPLRDDCLLMLSAIPKTPHGNLGAKTHNCKGQAGDNLVGGCERLFVEELEELAGYLVPNHLTGPDGFHAPKKPSDTCYDGEPPQAIEGSIDPRVMTLPPPNRHRNRGRAGCLLPHQARDRLNHHIKRTGLRLKKGRHKHSNTSSQRGICPSMRDIGSTAKVSNRATRRAARQTNNR